MIIARAGILILVCAALAHGQDRGAAAPAPTVRSLLGTEAPEITLGAPDDGAVSLSKILGERGVILVFPAAAERGLTESPIAKPKALEWAGEVPAFAVLAGKPREWTESGTSMAIDADDGARQAFSLDKYPETATKNTVLFIGPDRRIRRVELQAPGDEDSGLIYRRADQWHEGQRLYGLYCARCHGPDGTDTSYPNIKRLDGIGATLDEREIIDNTRATAFVNIDALPRDEREALAVFVASL